MSALFLSWLQTKGAESPAASHGCSLSSVTDSFCLTTNETHVATSNFSFLAVLSQVHKALLVFLKINLYWTERDRDHKTCYRNRALELVNRFTTTFYLFKRYISYICSFLWTQSSQQNIFNRLLHKKITCIFRLPCLLFDLYHNKIVSNPNH